MSRDPEAADYYATITRTRFGWLATVTREPRLGRTTFTVAMEYRYVPFAFTRRGIERKAARFIRGLRRDDQQYRYRP